MPLTRPRKNGSYRYGLFALSLLWYFLASCFLPLTQDEAYYLSWGENLRFGYLDHPPFVGWLFYLASYLSPSWLNFRLLTIALSLGTLWVMGKLIDEALSNDAAKRWASFFLHFNFAVLALGVLTTPDTLLAFFWVCALHETFLALTQNPKRWVLVGIFCGLGLWSKYTMVLFLPILLLVAWSQRPKKLHQEPYFYAGGLLAFFVFLPHLIWNSQNDWVSVRFQLNRRLDVSAPLQYDSLLLDPLPPLPGGREEQLARGFLETESKSEKPPVHWALKMTERVSGFFLSQLIFWGGFLGVAISSLLRRRKPLSEDPYLNQKFLFQVASLFPVLFFGVFSFLQKAESNWSAMYLFAAAPLLGAWFAKHLGEKIPVWSWFVQVLICALFIAHAKFQILPLKPTQDRVLKETYGYPELARYLETFPGPKFADSYQLVSLMNAYEPQLEVYQWPGITRVSEISRRGWGGKISDLQNGLTLLTTDVPPPRLAGFTPNALQRVKDCLTGLQVETIPSSASCRSPHTWYLVSYTSL